MPFIPHTEHEIQAMLKAIGVAKTEELFSEIPHELRAKALPDLPAQLTEMELMQHMQRLAKRDEYDLCFIGAGAYEHHIPAIVWDIASRGEFMTAYTPYQAEASQGTLQLLYEYQTMMASLTGMEASNASCYDGGSALAEAILMAVRANRSVVNKKVYLASLVNPAYLQTVETIISEQGIASECLPYDKTTGCTDLAALETVTEKFAALVIPFPNFMGCLDAVDELTEWAHARGALVIAVCYPMALGLLRAPGEWGKNGADIVCGEAQPFGMPLASGGPYAGFLCCKKEWVRQMPGRIVGRTVDAAGNPGFTLTLQAREQHIRRAKATSNICTNQGLLITAATIYLSVMGAEGLKRVAAASHAKTQELIAALSVIGIRPVFSAPVFNEVLLQLPISAEIVQQALAKKGIQAGFNAQEEYPELSNTLLVCVTETKQTEDIERYVHEIKQVIEECVCQA